MARTEMVRTGAVGQLALPVSLSDDTEFTNYLALTDGGAQAQHLLQSGLPPRSLVCLWGPAGTGKTHLALASSRLVQPALYLPLAALQQRSPEQVLGDVDGLALVVLDELDAVAGDSAWELAIFGLHNRVLDAGGRMLVVARASPRALPLVLADLRSRLLAGHGFGLQTYDDDQLLAILQFRAARMGLTLSADAARYLIHRLPRELNRLLEQLRVLDRAALAQQRQLTVPFIREVSGW